MTTLSAHSVQAWPAISIAEANARLTAPGTRFEIEELTIRGVRTRCWKHQPPTLRHVFALGRAYGQREFIVHENDRVTYTGFARAVLTLAHEFDAQGVRKGDRIAIVMRNLPEFPVAFFAASLCGAIATPLNAWWTGPELEYGLSNSGAKIALFDAERFARVATLLDQCANLTRSYITRAQPDHVLPPAAALLESVVGTCDRWHALPELPLPDVTIEPDDDATLFYTSGTTGKPKGALGTHRNICTNVSTGAFVTARALLRRGEPVVAPGPNDPQKVTLLVVPLFHVTGCNASLIPTIANGNKQVLMRKWDAEKAMQLIERERVTSAGGVPTIAWQLVEHPARGQYDLSSLESISYGGAPSAPELVRRIKEAFPQVKPGNGWGMTETSASFCSNTSEDYEHRPDSCGPAVPVAQIKIMSLDGPCEMQRGEVGELWVKGPQIIKGYWNMPEATASTFVDGWVKTGDLARVDTEGFCFIVDRTKDILIRGGENIYCIQVENVLYEHPSVMDAAVIGIPHRTLGEEPGAVVYLKPGTAATQEELRAFMALKLAAFQVPVCIRFWPEALPRNAAGKILKKELKAVFTAAP